MPDIIITPSTGKLEFIDDSVQVTRRHSFTLDPNDGLTLNAPLSAAAVIAPLNVINVTVDNSNNNYPFILASGSVGTGTKTLMMDGAGGTYNPFTNLATIDISGNSATTTLASDSTNLGGVGSANYVTLTGTQTLTNKTITGTFTGNLTGTGSWATNAVTAINSTQLNGQAASYYTNITARLGYTPVNKVGDTISGDLVVNGNFSVNGSFTAFSASNIYLTSSNLTVTDNILLMNALTPYQRYAGIQMYDSGSGTLSQFLWDGDGDYFFLTGSSVNGKIITGPDGQTNLTSNYIPKATAGYKLGNSVIYDDGTNVGVGTTVPSTKFHVFGNAEVGDSTADTGLIVRHGAGAAQYGRIRFYSTSTNIHTIHSFPTAWNGGTFLNASAGAMNLQGTNGITFGSWNNIDVAFAQGGNNYFKSNVGIGTTVPASLLHVYSTSAEPAIRLTSTSGSAKTYGLVCNTPWAPGSLHIYDYTADASRIHISSNGNVGIGVGATSPATQLHVVGVISGSSVNATTVNATSFVDSGLQSYGLREYVINFSAQSTASFYPIAIDSPPGTDGTWHHSFSIDEVNQGGAAAYNVHSMYGEVRGQGWTDQPYFHRVFHNFYDSAERSLLGVWRPTTSWYGVVVYVRGGKNYYVRTTSRSVNGYSSATNVGGTVTYAIKNAAGADVSGTSANIAEMLNLINNPSGFYHSDNAYIGTNQAIHLGTTSAPNLSIGGTAANATILQTARNIGGVSFNGSADINLPGVNTAGNQNTSGNAATATTASYANNINPANSYSAATVTTTGKLEAGGNVIAGGQFSGAGTGLTGTAAGLSIGGNAATATSAATWTTARTLTIGSTGKSVNGSSDITWTLAELGVNNATLTIATGSGISLSATPTFTANASVDKTITITNSGVTAITTNTGLSTNASATGAVTITNTGVTAITTNTGLSTNASATGAVTITNTGVTSNVAGTGISLSGGTGAVTITNSGVTSAVAGTGVGVSAATGAVTFSIGQSVGPANTPSFAGIISSAVTNYAFLQTTDTNNFWITPGNNNWGLYFETSAGGLLGGTGDSNRLGFVGAGTARFYVDLNNGNGWFGGALTAAGNISAANLSGTNTGDQTIGNGTITIAAGTGVGVGSSNTFTTNQSGATTVTITNTGVTAITTNTGLSTNTSATGAVTITNTGVTSVAGTSNQVSVSAGTGTVTFSLPQNIHTAATPTFASVTTSADGANITMAGTTNAEGIRMTPASSTTYPVFLRSVNPGVGEASPWIYKEQATDWGIWHNNPVNSIDFTKAGSGGITSNVGGSSTNTVTVRVEMATGYVQTIAGYRNSAGTTILSDAGNITGNAATVTTNANLTGDVTSTGNATTIASNAVTSVKIADSNVTLAKIVNISTGTILGNNGAGAAAPLALTSAQVAAMLSGQTMNIAGNAATATILQTARNIGGVSFNGSADINLPGVNTAGNQNTSGNAATATTATNANAISFTEVELNAPITVSGTWTTGNGSEWGEPKFGTSFNQFRYTDGNGPYVEYNIPANHHSCFISQLQWDTGGYADCHGVQSDGDLVFLRRINTRQLVENSNHGNTIQHDGATVTFAGSGLQAFTKIRITNRLGRIHMTGIAFTRQIDDGYEGTGMVHPAQISHQGAGSGLDADLLDGYSSATANTANTIVLRDASGNFSAGTITATLSGTATTATTANALNTGNNYTVTNLVATGNIGIGTSTLDANCLATFKTSNTARVCMTDGTTRAHFWPTGGNFYISTETASDLILITNANERIRIQSGGNVGVGTTAPGQKLDVEGRIRTRGATGTGGFEIGAATTGTAKWRIEWDSASDSLDFNWVG